MIDRFEPRAAAATRAAGAHDPVVIRRVRDADAPYLHDLAELDSVAPLQGPVLVAVVDGRIWAALGLNDDRAVADPFVPAAAAVELLRLRARQVRGGSGRRARRWLARRIPRRA